MSYAHLSEGTEVYYTGDMANQSGSGRIVKLRGPFGYDIELRDGRRLLGISSALFGKPVNHCGHRFQLVTERRSEGMWVPK